MDNHAKILWKEQWRGPRPCSGTESFLDDGKPISRQPVVTKPGVSRQPGVTKPSFFRQPAVIKRASLAKNIVVNLTSSTIHLPVSFLPPSSTAAWHKVAQSTDNKSQQLNHSHFTRKQAFSPDELFTISGFLLQPIRADATRGIPALKKRIKR